MAASPLFLSLTVVLAATIVYVQCQSHSASSLSVDFYKISCPKVEKIVQDAVIAATKEDPTNPGPLFRLVFHDCFVSGGKKKKPCGGCDGSVLLNHTGSEQDAPPNLTLAGFDIIEAIKATLEKKCPGVVSCADILVLVARYAVLVSHGPDIPFPLGRRDASYSSAARAAQCLPNHASKVPALIKNFKRVGLDVVDLVALSGSHTIGQSHCSNIQDRLYSSSGKRQLDPTLDATYAKNVLYPTCKRLIPLPKTVDDVNAQNQTFMDSITNFKFDNKYFVGLKKHVGLFTSDQDLLSNKRTSKLVNLYAKSQKAFFKDFAQAMIDMANINVLTGNEGVISKYCFRR